MPRKIAGVMLLLLVSVFEMWAQGEVVLRIDGQPVGLSEFEYYYRKDPAQTLESFMQSFVDYKLKARYAHDAGMDTLPSFRIQQDYYQGILLKPHLMDKNGEEQEARWMYERGKQRLQTNDWIRIAHISKYLPQNATRQAEVAARQLMDSIYSALRGGSDFAALAFQYSDDAESRNVGGLLPWMPVNKNVQEWVDRLSALEKDRISTPFYSPLGIHIVKWIDRKPSVSYEERREQILDCLETDGHWTLRDVPTNDRNMALCVQELHEGLLVACLDKVFQSGSDKGYEEKDLERYYKLHESDYKWNLPHYKGAVFHCKDKKTASTIKKYLKDKPIAVWSAALERYIGDPNVVGTRMETGVFQIGENPYVDKLVFECGSFQPDPVLPYTFVMGKKLKKGPEDYVDVKERVIRDYSAAYGDTFMKKLREKYKVEINQEVLKTVNYNGSD